MKYAQKCVVLQYHVMVPKEKEEGEEQKQQKQPQQQEEEEEEKERRVKEERVREDYVEVFTESTTTHRLNNSSKYRSFPLLLLGDIFDVGFDQILLLSAPRLKKKEATLPLLLSSSAVLFDQTSFFDPLADDYSVSFAGFEMLSSSLRTRLHEGIHFLNHQNRMSTFKQFLLSSAASSSSSSSPSSSSSSSSSSSFSSSSLLSSSITPFSFGFGFENEDDENQNQSTETLPPLFVAFSTEPIGSLSKHTREEAEETEEMMKGGEREPARDLFYLTEVIVELQSTSRFEMRFEIINSSPLGRLFILSVMLACRPSLQTIVCQSEDMLVDVPILPLSSRSFTINTNLVPGLTSACQFDIFLEYSHQQQQQQQLSDDQEQTEREKEKERERERKRNEGRRTERGQERGQEREENRNREEEIPTVGSTCRIAYCSVTSPTLLQVATTQKPIVLPTENLFPGLASFEPMVMPSTAKTRTKHGSSGKDGHLIESDSDRYHQHSVLFYPASCSLQSVKEAIDRLSLPCSIAVSPVSSDFFRVTLQGPHAKIALEILSTHLQTQFRLASFPDIFVHHPDIFNRLNRLLQSHCHPTSPQLSHHLTTAFLLLSSSSSSSSSCCSGFD
jgi:hypothetical protein